MTDEEKQRKAKKFLSQVERDGLGNEYRYLWRGELIRDAQ